MDKKETAKLKLGDKVVWPKGANGCPYKAKGVVTRHPTKFLSALYVKWDDGQNTFLSDWNAMKFVQVTA